MQIVSKYALQEQVEMYLVHIMATLMFQNAAAAETSLRYYIWKSGGLMLIR